jgi:hypothetical protein
MAGQRLFAFETRRRAGRRGSAENSPDPPVRAGDCLPSTTPCANGEGIVVSSLWLERFGAQRRRYINSTNAAGPCALPNQKRLTQARDRHRVGFMQSSYSAKMRAANS